MAVLLLAKFRIGMPRNSIAQQAERRYVADMGSNPIGVDSILGADRHKFG